MCYDSDYDCTADYSRPAWPAGSWLAGEHAQDVSHPFTYLRRLHDTYGDLVALAQGDPSNVVAFGPSINFRLLSEPDLFRTDAPQPLLKLSGDTAFGRFMQNNLPTMNGEKHRQHRRLMQPAFHKQQVTHYRDDMVTLTQSMLDSWREKSEFDVSIEMKLLTQRIAVKTLFGLYDEAEMERIGQLLLRMTRSMMFVLLAPIDIPGTPYHRVLRIAGELETFMRSLIAQKREQPEATDVLAALVHAYDEGGVQLSDEELIGHAFTVFVAGHETTANALAWTAFLLDQHPHVQADLLDELSSVLHGEAPTIEQLKQLPLLDGVIKESLRLLPPASIGVRATGAPCELGGFDLPKGANIIYSEFVTHRLSELYEEPDRFKPERWSTLDRSPYEYLPFSAGRHMCIGAGFAIQELKVVVAMLLQRYRLSIVPNTRVAANISMRPTPGMPMRVFPQDRQFQRVPVRGGIHQLVDLAQ